MSMGFLSTQRRTMVRIPITSFGVGGIGKPSRSCHLASAFHIAVVPSRTRLIGRLNAVGKLCICPDFGLTVDQAGLRPGGRLRCAKGIEGNMRNGVSGSPGRPSSNSGRPRCTRKRVIAGSVSCAIRRAACVNVQSTWKPSC